MSGAVRDATLLILYCSLIFWLSDRPALPVPMLFPFQDKLHHFLAYGVMGWLAWRSLGHRLTGGGLWLAAVLFCSLYGISDEFHQSFVPGRQTEVGDWLADTLGGVFSATFLYRLRKNVFNGGIMNGSLQDEGRRQKDRMSFGRLQAARRERIMDDPNQHREP